jgi:hypothetical protein
MEIAERRTGNAISVNDSERLSGEDAQFLGLLIPRFHSDFILRRISRKNPERIIKIILRTRRLFIL